MKGKIIRGKGFYGLLLYLLLGNKKSVRKLVKIIGGNLLSQTAKALAKEFAVVRRLRPDCKTPVLHVPLRLPPGEALDQALWNKIAMRYFELMELTPDRPWILVFHDEHVHLATSRISYSGELWHGKWEALNHIAATQTLEREFGLTITPGLEGADDAKVRLTSGQLAKAKGEIAEGKDPEIPAKVYIAEVIELTLAEGDGSYEDFVRRLKARSVNAQRNEATTGHVSGISFEFQNIEFKGSKIARAYGWNKLLKRLNERKKQYEQQRNSEQYEATSPQSNPERTTDPTGPTATRTGGVGSENRHAIVDLPSLPLPASQPPEPMADTNLDSCDASRPADNLSPVSATPLEHSSNSVEHAVPATSAAPESQQPAEHQTGTAGRGHDEDLRLAEEACHSVSTPIPDPGAELTQSEDPELPPPMIR